MMDPAYQSIFEALSLCSLQWFFKKTDLSVLTGLEKTPLSMPIPWHSPLCPVSQVLPVQHPANLTTGFFAGISWFHFRGVRSGMGCSLCCAIRMHSSKYVVLLYHCETFYGATLSGNCRPYERYNKPCESQILKGLKFPSAIPLLLFHKGNQSPWGFFKAYTWL